MSAVETVRQLVLICLLCASGSFALAQVGEHPAAKLEAMFESFGQQAGPLAPMFGKLSPEQLQRIEAVPISLLDERKFGQGVLEAYLSQLEHAQISTTQGGRDIGYLEQLCSRLRPFMQNSKRYQKLEIRIVETQATDAYSIPGGRLLITRGLLDGCGSEAALVGTLAHELSHLDRGHQLLPLKRSKLMQQPLDFTDSMMVISLVARPFRPEQESEADRDATQWMMASGYAPSELAKLLHLWEQRQAQQLPWMQFLPSMLKSHPNPGLRATAVLQQAQQLKPQYPQATFVGVENLRQRSPMTKMPR